jgi:AraC family transcriptional regulator
MSRGRTWDREYGSLAEFYEQTYGQQISMLKTTDGLGSTLIEATQSAGDWSDAPTPDLTIGWLARESVELTCDLGAGRFRTSMRADEAILIAPGIGSTVLVDRAHVIRILAVPYSALVSLAGPGAALPSDGDFGKLHGGLLRSSDLGRLLGALWNETHSGSAHGSLFADGLMLQVIGTLLRMRDAGERTRPSAPGRGGLAPWQLRRICDRLQADLSSDPGLPDLATLIGLSTEHFCRAFKASTGLPPHAWLVARRVERARELLEGTNLPVEEIAAQVGYAEPSHLARMFRRAHGMSPTQYRRERRT